MPLESDSLLCDPLCEPLCEPLCVPLCWLPEEDDWRLLEPERLDEDLAMMKFLFQMHELRDGGSIDTEL